MTREVAKNWLNRLYLRADTTDEYGDMEDVQPYEEALDVAFQALEQEPCDVFDKYGNYKYPSDVELTEPNTVTSMPCVDAISREDALMALTGEWTESTDELIHRFIKRIKNLPPVTPQPKTGHWIIVEEMHSEWEGVKKYACDKCGEKVGIFKSNYCPNCGAKMNV